MLTDRDLKRYIKAALKNAQEHYPEIGTVRAIDGNLVDIQIGSSPSYLRNVKVIGDPNSLTIGQDVKIVWSASAGNPAKAPTVVVEATGPVYSPLIAADEVTITKSSSGIAVKPRGIGLEHLNFEPALNGHSHTDSLGLGGWQVTSDGILYNGTTYIHPNGMIVLGTGADILYLATEGDYRMWAGATSPTSAPYSLSKTGVVRIGGGNPNIVIDGPNALIKTSDFSAGYDGWKIDKDGDAEFNNVTVRGALTTAVFVKGLVEAHAGTMVIAKSAGKLAADYIINGTLTIEDPPTGADWLFDNNDRVHIRSEYASGIADVWLIVTRAATVNQYATSRQSGTSSGTIPKGAAALDYGQSGQGVLMMTADNGIYANAPYYEVFTHAGSPWSTQTRRARLGNLTGITYDGDALSGYGLWTNNAYLEGELSAASGDVKIDGDGIHIVTPTSVADKNSVYWTVDASTDGRIAGYYSSPWMNILVESKNYDTSGAAQLVLQAITSVSASPMATKITIIQRDDADITSSQIYFNVNDTLVAMFDDDQLRMSKSITVQTGDTLDIGTSGAYFNNIYVRTVHADTIEGAAMSGQAWEYAGTPMYIRPNTTANSEVQIVNPNASYTASLYVEGNITLGGSVDGVDISSHAGDANAHHNRSHTYDSTSDHSGTLSWTNVNKTGSSLADLATRNHSNLQNIGVNDHHNQQHSYDSTTDHSGTLSWSNVNKTGSNLTDLATRNHSGLQSIGANDHHNQMHAITGADHTITASAMQVVGATATDTLGLLTPSSSPGAASAILKSDSNGYLQLTRLGIGVSPSYPLHVSGTSEQLRLAYTGGGYASFTVNSGGQLTIAPVGDLVLDPGGNDVLPAIGYDINLGTMSKKFLSLHAASLVVETLVEQDTIATIGGRILVGPTTSLVYDISDMDTVFALKHNQMRYNDIVYMSALGQFEFVRTAGLGMISCNVLGKYFVFGGDLTAFLVKDVYIRIDASLSGIHDGVYTVSSSSYAVGNTTVYVNETVNSGTASGYLLYYTESEANGPYVYQSLSRNENLDGAYDWYAGGAVFNTGTTGNGFIDLYSMHGMYSASDYGPTIVGNIRTGISYNQIREFWAVGNLNGLFGYSTNTYGIGLGSYNATADTASGWMTIDATNGIRMYGYDGTLMGRLSGTSFVLGSSSGSYYMTITPTSISLNGSLQLPDSNTVISEGGNNSVKITTNYGYVEVGAQNANYAHFYTDRPAYYFNAPVVVNGDVRTLNKQYQSYSSSLSGWTSASTTLYYKQVGNLVFVLFGFSGTSNNATHYLTLPVSMNTSVNLNGVYRVNVNGTWAAAAMTINTATANRLYFYDIAGSNLPATNTLAVYGIVIYEAA